MLSARFDRALALASQLHRDQKRKGTDIPYIGHLLAVTALVIEHGGSEDQAIAALLHDAVEDQGGEVTLRLIDREFGPAVETIVADCTDAWVDPKPAWRARKEDYLAHLPAKTQTSLLVSLADKTHNAESILADRRAIGEDIWSRFTGGRDGTRWYYRALCDVFAERIPSRLTDRLEGAVALLEKG